jgi:ketosteroid isomerase-like protein
VARAAAYQRLTELFASAFYILREENLSKPFRTLLLTLMSGAAILALASCNKHSAQNNPTEPHPPGTPASTATATNTGPASGAQPAAPIAPADTTADTQKTIQDLTASWTVAMNNKDVDATARTYADDATFMPPDQPAATTPDAIHQAWASLLATPGFSGIETTSTKLMVAGSNDMAVDVGTYKETVSDPSSPTAPPNVLDGKYVTTWAKENGEWKVVADIFNSDAPVAPAASATTAPGAPVMQLGPGDSSMAPTESTTPDSTMSPDSNVPPAAPDTGAPDDQGGGVAPSDQGGAPASPDSGAPSAPSTDQ